MPPRRTPQEQAWAKFKKHVERIHERIAKMEKAHEGRMAPLIADLQKYEELMDQMESDERRSEA